VSILRKRVGAQRLGVLPRSVGLITIGAVSALVLAACGSGPSASLSAAQDISAGIASQGAGQYASAAKYYEKAIALQPKSAVALYNLGDVEQLENLDAAAKSHYLAALAIDPNFISAIYNLATLEANSSPVEAEALYEQVIRLSPNDASAHFNLGYVLISLGHRSAGVAQIDRGIKLNPALKSRVGNTLSTTTTTTTTAP
jgi:tetratricopeptide (TPR) repeat protein